MTARTYFSHTTQSPYIGCSMIPASLAQALNRRRRQSSIGYSRDGPQVQKSTSVFIIPQSPLMSGESTPIVGSLNAERSFSRSSARTSALWYSSISRALCKALTGSAEPCFIVSIGHVKELNHLTFALIVVSANDWSDLVPTIEFICFILGS